MTSNPESALLRTFATVTDALVDEFDLLDTLQTLVEACTDLLEASAGGILLLGVDGHLDLVASSDESNRIIELLQLDAEAGPCGASFRTGRTVTVTDIATVPATWSAFRDDALAQGFTAAYAEPLRLRQQTIGALSLVSTHARADERDLLAARALADVATIAILQDRAIRDSDSPVFGSQSALDSLSTIEQAKRVIADTRGISMEAASTVLRDFASTNRRPLGTIATAVVEHRLVIPD